MKSHPEKNRGPAFRRRLGFTLAELVVATGLSTLVAGSAISVFLFVSKDGRALNAQIEFSQLARSLQSEFIEKIEACKCLRLDVDMKGVLLYDANEQESWIGYREGTSVRDGKILYRPHGKDSRQGERTLCTWVSPSDSGAQPFELYSGVSVGLNVHIGDAAEGEADSTGPGRQGVDVQIIGSCHDLRRKIL